MKFIPNYRVCYNGQFHEALKEFEIDPADSEEMKEHGRIIGKSEDKTDDETTDETEQQDEAEKTESKDETAEEKPKRGRPTKESKNETD